jgi:hypothetical protein
MFVTMGKATYSDWPGGTIRWRGAPSAGWFCLPLFSWRVGPTCQLAIKRKAACAMWSSNSRPGRLALQHKPLELPCFAVTYRIQFYLKYEHCVYFLKKGTGRLRPQASKIWTRRRPAARWHTGQGHEHGETIKDRSDNMASNSPDQWRRRWPNSPDKWRRRWPKSPD